MIRIFLRPVGLVICDVCVKAFCGFIVVAYFTALGTVGNFDPPNRSMTLVISLSFICFSSLNKFQTKLMLSYIKSNKSIALTENQM